MVPFPFIVNNHRFASAEHFMMAEKARLFGDFETLDKIIYAPNPGAAKAFGREVRGFKQDVWDENRFAIVVAANMAKFSQNKELGQFYSPQMSVYSLKLALSIKYGE